MPLIWLSVVKDELKDARNDYEDACPVRLREVLPDGVKVIILSSWPIAASATARFSTS